MRATLKNYRQSPRKVRIVADLVKGKRVEDALIQLSFVSKRASHAIKKLIMSAVANAGNNSSEKPENLLVSSIRVDEGVVLKRYRPRARGRSAPIKKRTSQVTVELKEAKKKEPKTEKSS